jgi:hypothetical protein
MTSQQLRLVPIEWRKKHELQVHLETGKVIEEWHTVALYIDELQATVIRKTYLW